MPPTAIGLLVSLLQAHAAVLDNLAEDIEARAGIPLSWHEVLARVAGAPDSRVRMQELAETVLLTPSGLTRLADRMEQKGLIERAACPTDRRGTFVTITDAGREALARSAPVFEASVRARIEDQLTKEERAVLRRALAKIALANPTDRFSCGTP